MKLDVFVIASDKACFRYNEQNQVVDFIFPPLDSCERNKELNTQDFSSFNYWKQEFSEILHHELL